MAIRGNINKVALMHVVAAIRRFGWKQLQGNREYVSQTQVEVCPFSKFSQRDTVDSTENSKFDPC